MESRNRVHLLAAAVLAGAALLGAAPARARVLLAQKDALALAFPGAVPQRRTAFLTDEQARAAEKAARAKLETRVWTYYVAGSTFAYFESHPVRTMNETIMVVIGADGAVQFVEILSFAEPDDYLASPRWLAQFNEKPLDDELALRRGLRGITGATLTAEAVARGVRRALAVHGVINPRLELLSYSAR
ncbi:MAG: FMN-binding protein [Elusimicrobiota bacterium]|nr:MAG: FMN-binding protein [Elusimicrobiota bacterium]